MVLCLGFAVPAPAGTVRGRVGVVEKSGKKASDVADAVVWVEGPRVKPSPSNATVTMKGKAFAPRVSRAATLSGEERHAMSRDQQLSKTDGASQGPRTGVTSPSRGS